MPGHLLESASARGSPGDKDRKKTLRCGRRKKAPGARRRGRHPMPSRGPGKGERIPAPHTPGSPSSLPQEVNRSSDSLRGPLCV